MAKNLRDLELAMDARLSRLEKGISALLEAGPMAGVRPADYVVSPRKHLESQDMEDPNGSGVATIDLGDDDRPHIELPRNTDVASRAFEEKAAELAFMEEFVTIDVHPAGARDKPIPFPVMCNGKVVALMPGRQARIRRKYLGVLIAARPVHYDNVEYERDGIKGVDHPFWRGPRFPFSIVQDTAKGMQWFRDQMAAP